MARDERPCIYCVAEFPHECEEQGDSTDRSGISETGESSTPRAPGRPPKELGDFLDPISSGRKRAAEAAPITVGLVCEWAYLKHAGGGPVPIQGCLGNPATDRHHGPDKSTLNNEVGVNLHRICAYCHNRWHAANDEAYGSERPADNSEWLPETVEWSPHDPDSRLSKMEALAAEMMRTKK